MTAARSFSICALALALLISRSASAADADAARDELRAGYALKQQGDCRGALPHLLASYRLDPKPKALLNAADCEQRLGELVAARTHAQDGLDLATRLGDAELAAVARDQLAAVDRRVARITISAADALPVSVSLDGAAVSIATVAMVNPGRHDIVVRAVSHLDRTYPVTLGEGARETIEVSAGEPIATPSPVAVEPLAPREERTNAPSSINGRRLVAITLGGAGVVAVGIGSVFGVVAVAKNGDSNANGHCNATSCDATGRDLRNTALSDASASTWLIGLGLPAIVGGGIWYLMEPSDGTRISLGPMVGPSSGGLKVGGAW
jgi:hypothetical protein